MGITGITVQYTKELSKQTELPLLHFVLITLPDRSHRLAFDLKGYNYPNAGTFPFGNYYNYAENLLKLITIGLLSHLIAGSRIKIVKALHNLRLSSHWQLFIHS